MKVFAEPKHPNALKILVASAISGRSLPVVQKQGVLGGAQLEVEGLYSISANSAVLYLLREASDQEVDENAREQDEKWLQWESCELQGSLVPYLQSLDSGREDKNAIAALSTVLRPFMSALTDAGTLMPGKLTVADIVILCSLLPLHRKAGANSLFREHPDLINYLDKFLNNETVKNCVQSWYGSLSIELKPWVNTLVGPQAASLPSTFELVCKGAQKQSPKQKQEEDSLEEDENNEAIEALLENEGAALLPDDIMKDMNEDIKGGDVSLIGEDRDHIDSGAGGGAKLTEFLRPSFNLNDMADIIKHLPEDGNDDAQDSTMSATPISSSGGSISAAPTATTVFSTSTTPSTSVTVDGSTGETAETLQSDVPTLRASQPPVAPLGSAFPGILPTSINSLPSAAIPQGRQASEPQILACLPGPPKIVTTTSGLQSQILTLDEDEALGPKATKAAILYTNINKPNLKSEYPANADGENQIRRTCKNLVAEQRQIYAQKARQNRKEYDKNKQVANKDVEVMTEEELAQACVSWGNDDLKPGVHKSNPIPVLPVAGQSNILVTSALPYVNNVPHLGNIIGCVLSADCFARFCRMRGDNVLYICGTDEYGTATETKAIAEGLTPRQICDQYHVIHADIYRWFNISFDHFGRTTTEHQTKIAQDIFLSLERNKLITKNSVDQLYCERCERFLADRFVEGTCPHLGCGYEDARGDQCDACGKLINATDLKNPRCKLCSDTPRFRTSKHLFLDLPKLETKLQSWIDQSSHHWSANAKVICDSWLRDGLKERCITRDLKWGTPVPLEGYTDKVFYVWYDAPIGYISITMDYTSKWKKWWQNPSEVKYYEFMAKDNVPFHSVVFPACQLGTGQPWTMVTYLSATEYLNFEDGKFSKSRGVGVFGDQVKDTGIPSDIWRFYLLYIRPEAHDAVFSWSDFQLKVNSELLNNIGNFVNRALKFVYQFYKGIVPNANPSKTDFAMMAEINKELKNYRDMLAVIKIRDGLRHILSITRIGNLYIQENEPFKLIKSDRIDDKQRAATVVNVSVNIVALVALILNPYMPETSAKVLEYLNVPQLTLHLPQNFTSLIPAGHVIKEPAPLIQKITNDQVARLRKQFAGNVVSSVGPVEAPAIERSPADGEFTKAKTPSSVVDGEVDISHLQKLISDQGNKVRNLKKSGFQKDVWEPEVSVLLALKQKLALAEGIPPSTVKSSSKDKKKKKK